MMAYPSNLWNHRDFRFLWISQTLAALSSHVTQLAVLLIAALSLHASPFEIGLLTTIATLPNILVGVVAGPWIDRVHKRPLMIATNLVRAGLLASVPLATALNALTMAQLYVILFLFDSATTVFDVARESYLPTLVGREHVLPANSRIAATMSVAQALGPGLAGWLIQLLTAPIAILVDALSLTLSVFFLHAIDKREVDSVLKHHRVHLQEEIADGLRPLFRDPLLRSITGSSMIYLFFNNIMVAIYVVYATQELAIVPISLGTIYGLGGAGAVIGSFIAIPAARRFGIGYTLIVANLVGGLFLLLVPFAQIIPSPALLILGIAQLVSQMMGAVFYINQTSLRQMITPPYLLGRANASYRFLTMGMIPFGSFFGGLLGEMIGLHRTLLIAGIGVVLPVLWLMQSPVWTLHRLESDASQGETSGLPSNEQ